MAPVGGAEGGAGRNESLICASKASAPKVYVPGLLVPHGEPDMLRRK